MSNLSVGGLRGMSTPQTLTMAIPNGASGSGLTAIVGSNNAGKSTLIEALRHLSLSGYRRSSFPDNQRNKRYGDRVDITLKLDSGIQRSLRSVRDGGSEVRREPEQFEPIDMLVIPSRRTFPTLFGNPGAPLDRASYVNNFEIPTMKSATLDHFGGRLFKINGDAASRANFDRLLGEVVSPVPDWTIDQSDSGQYFLKFRWKDSVGAAHSHSSDGLGEGLVSLFFIIDGLYDSTPGGTIVIDEPELSLHPQFQRRLRDLLARMASDRSVIIATHSPYFLNWVDFEHGATVARVFKGEDGTVVAQPRRETLLSVARLAHDSFNPHVLGLDANEVFFLEDNVVLVEGQEDVVYLRRVLDELGVQMSGNFYGWGVGGAEKMGTISQLLVELGYSSVAGILDNDKESVRIVLSERFPQYKYACIAAADIRDKVARRPVEAKVGLTTSNGRIKDEFRQVTRDLLVEIGQYFDRQGDGAALKL